MSTETKQLQLFKYNPQTDGSLYFLFNDGLNNNWDKIDAFAEQTQTKLDLCVTRDTIATKDRLGLVQAGNNVDISPEGVISVKSAGIDEDRVIELIEQYGGNSGGNKVPGEIVISLDPISSESLRLLDGSEIATNGIYKEFVDTYIKPLKEAHPERFLDDFTWQTKNYDNGTCDYYVYNEETNMVRLPNLMGFVAASKDNIDLETVKYLDIDSVKSALQFVVNSINTAHTEEETYTPITLPEITDKIYMKYNKAYYYIVVANGVNMSIAKADLLNAMSEINNLSYALNDKVGFADTSSSDPSALEETITDGYFVSDNGICFQWGTIAQGQAIKAVELFNPYLENCQYQLFINPINSSTQWNCTIQEKRADYFRFTTNTSAACHWMTVGVASSEFLQAVYNIDGDEENDYMG